MSDETQKLPPTPENIRNVADEIKQCRDAAKALVAAEQEAKGPLSPDEIQHSIQVVAFQCANNAISKLNIR